MMSKRDASKVICGPGFIKGTVCLMVATFIWMIASPFIWLLEAVADTYHWCAVKLFGETADWRKNP